MKTRFKKLTQDRTPEEATLSRSQRRVGDAVNIREPSIKDRLRSSRLSRDIPVRRTEVSTTAAPRKRKSIFRACKQPCRQLRSRQDRSAPGKDTSALASSVQQPPQKKQSFTAMFHKTWLSMMQHRPRRRRRDRKKEAAALERVRQWEIRLLQDLEEAAQHQLTIEIEKKKPVIQFNTEDQSDAASKVHTGRKHLDFWTHVH